MDNMYNRIMALCESKGISGYKLCKDLNIRKSILTDLKTGRQSGMNAHNAALIAEYFNVSVDYLLGRDEGIKKEPDSEDAAKLSNPKVQELVEKINSMSDAELDALEHLVDTFENLRGLKDK